MNRFTLRDSDTAQLEFGGQLKGKSYKIKILTAQDLPRISTEQSGAVVFNDNREKRWRFEDIS